jgi:hypothetical protein
LQRVGSRVNPFVCIRPEKYKIVKVSFPGLDCSNDAKNDVNQIGYDDQNNISEEESGFTVVVK